MKMLRARCTYAEGVQDPGLRAMRYKHWPKPFALWYLNQTSKIHARRHMQVVDFWIPYNFFSLAPLIYRRYSTSHTHTQKSVKLFKSLNKDMVACLRLSKFEKMLPAFKFYFSFPSMTVSLSPPQTHWWKNEDVQMGCSFSVRLLCKYGIRKRRALETQMYARHPNHHVWAASASLKYASSSPGRAVWGQREM